MHATHPGPLDWIRPGALVLVLVLAVPSVRADDAASKPESAGQLEQLLAPIALYPDSLIAQILMASTYPLEVVEAARWAKDNPKLKGKALEDAMKSQDWDPSVKSLTAFPQTLEMMSDKLDWTSELGDVFLAQQKQVMNTVQVLRQKAKAAGNLESNDQQKVTEKPEATGSQTQTIIIEPANPQVVYVPTYNPMMIYGPWPYPMYRPFYWYPPGYVATTSMISFGIGLSVGAAMWGGCNWGRGDVDININKYNSFNRTNIKNSNWKHSAAHRKGVSYRNKDLQKRFGGRQAKDVQSREKFRGRAEQGRQKIARGDADSFKGKSPRSTLGKAGGSAGIKKRAGGLRSGDRQFGKGSGARSSSRGGSAFKGMGNARATRRNSNRGGSSRASRFGGGGGGGRSRGGGRRSGGRR